MVVYGLRINPPPSCGPRRIGNLPLRDSPPQWDAERSLKNGRMPLRDSHSSTMTDRNMCHCRPLLTTLSYHGALAVASLNISALRMEGFFLTLWSENTFVFVVERASYPCTPFPWSSHEVCHIRTRGNTTPLPDPSVGSRLILILILIQR